MTVFIELTELVVATGSIATERSKFINPAHIVTMERSTYYDYKCTFVSLVPVPTDFHETIRVKEIPEEIVQMVRRATQYTMEKRSYDD